MKAPKIEDFKQGFESFKMNDRGTESKFSFLYPTGNLSAHAKFDKYKLDLLPQASIVDLLNSMKPFIATYEGYATALHFDNLNGGNELLSQEIEGKRREYMSNLFVTGIRVSGSADKQNISITYKKISKDGKINGHATQGILIEGNAFGFEQELQSVVDEIIDEVFEYIYKDKHSESDQSELEIWQSGHEVIQEAGEEEPDEIPEESKKGKKK